MNKVVADTMALVLRLEKRRMPEQARIQFQLAEEGKLNLLIPAMVLAEIGYLSERGRIDCTLSTVLDYLRRYPSIELYPLDWSVIQKTFVITDIPELHDRIIAATAALLTVKLITNDPKIEASVFVETIWR